MNEQASNSWAESKEDFIEGVIPILRKYGNQIGEEARNGAVLPTKIMSSYKLLFSSFDPMTADLLKEHLSAWLTSKGFS